MKLIKKLIPKSVKAQVKKYKREREKNALFGDLAPLVPSPETMYDGPKDYAIFKANGEEFLRICIDQCGLRPEEKMLDVGSGLGRKALPLTQYFTKLATYDGIDLAKAGIDWCRDGIGHRFPNFRFQQIDVYNKHYNPEGRCVAAEYRFPFADKSFSFVLLASVFTHMLPADVENYMSEISRVTMPGGRCLITYFLLNKTSTGLIEAGKSTLDFKYALPVFRTTLKDVPEQAIAFDESWILDLYKRAGLKVTRVTYGSWCGRAEHLSYQDIIVAVKE